MASLAFFVAAIGLVASAVAVIAARNLVHAAVAMVAHFVLTAALYVLLAAPFVAAAQLIVYAGAIMVLFLFVVMIAGDRRVPITGGLGAGRLLVVEALVILGGTLAAAASRGLPAAPAGGAVADVPPDFGSPAALAEVLFRDYVLELEVVGVLLLTAMVGAVVLARHVTASQSEDPTADAEGGKEGR
jgi:NADH:ubiquinone oxidoreductase subunit 6 (subunit J)